MFAIGILMSQFNCSWTWLPITHLCISSLLTLSLDSQSKPRLNCNLLPSAEKLKSKLVEGLLLLGGGIIITWWRDYYYHFFTYIHVLFSINVFKRKNLR